MVQIFEVLEVREDPYFLTVEVEEGDNLFLIFFIELHKSLLAISRDLYFTINFKNFYSNN